MPRPLLRRDRDEEPEGSIRVEHIAYNKVIAEGRFGTKMIATKAAQQGSDIDIQIHSSREITLSLQDLGHFYEKCLEQLS